jgi:hypothetical protein
MLELPRRKDLLNRIVAYRRPIEFALHYQHSIVVLRYYVSALVSSSNRYPSLPRGLLQLTGTIAFVVDGVHSRIERFRVAHVDW